MRFFWILCLCSPFSWALEFVIEDKVSFGHLSAFKGSELCTVAENTKHYLTVHTDDNFAVQSGKAFGGKMTLAQVKQTLDFICQTYRQDVRTNRQSRLHDKVFLQQHFDFIRWYPDKTTANKIAQKSTNQAKTRMLENIPEDKIFLTKYYTKLLDASPVKTSVYNQALYALPYDEQGLTQQQANYQKASLTRFQYTRQQIIAGALLAKKLAKPLVWITEEALHDVLLQGTGVLNVDGKIRYFNVHRNNDIAYDYSIGKREQARYWYFAEVPSIMGYGTEIDNKIAVRPYVTFAGNVNDLGLGKLIMVNYQRGEKKVSQMGVLADQGGAFDNNLFQLDLLVDSYRGWQDFHRVNKDMADYAEAWIMVLKPQFLN